MITSPPWYRIATWAREGRWFNNCSSKRHMSYSRGSRCIEVVFSDGRMVSAERHHHDQDDEIFGSELLKEDDDFGKIQEWFGEMI